MKTHLLFTLLLALFCSPAFSQNTYVPDDNFEQALIDLGIDSGELNDSVPTDKIAQRTTLEIFNKNIIDLTGIEDFVALEYLNCSNNQLTSLDIQNNTKLNNLRCGSNPITALTLDSNTELKELTFDWTQITSLQLSENPKIEKIGCYNAQLSELDVSMLDSLSYLHVGNNELISLDLSNNPKLSYLDCSSNELSSLNLKNGNIANLAKMYASGNRNLFCIEVDDVAAAEAKGWDKDSQAAYSENCGTITAQNTYVPDDNFEQALIDLGWDSGELNDSVPTVQIAQRTYLDIVNKNISDLTGIEDFAALENLDCSKNNLSSFNALPDLINLKELKIYTNQLTSLNTSANTALERLLCYDNQLSALNLQNYQNLQELSCSHNQLISLDLQHNTKLTYLRCTNNAITGLNMDANTELKELYCDNTQVTSLQFPENSKIEKIGCYSSQLTELDVSMLDSLSYLHVRSNELISLDLSNNPKLSYFDCSNNDLTSLNLKNGNIEGLNSVYASGNHNLFCIEVDDVAAAEAKGWTKDSEATYSEDCGTITAQNTYVPDDNFEQALVDLGWDSGELNDSVPTVQIVQKTYLNIVNKNISDLTGIEDFAALDYLNMQNNQVTSIDVSKNQNLKKLWCNGNPIGSLNLRNNPGLEDLQCKYTNIAELILPDNSKLKEINCESSQLSELDVSGLDSLQKISLYGNKLTHLDLSANMKLEEVRCANNQLKTLLLPENGLIKKIECQDNKISKLAGILDSGMKKNATVDNTSSLTFLNVLKNNFVFADFEPNWEKLSTLPSFFYNNQNPVGVEKDTSVVRGTNFNLEIEGYTPGENDQYTWYKNQMTKEGEINMNLLFDPVEYADSGRYNCDITNSLIPNLTLHMYQTIVHVTIPVGIEDIKNTQLKVYPNPATNKVYVETGSETSLLRVLNQAGQTLHIIDNFTSGSLDISSLTHGIYYIQINNTKETSTFKLLVK